MSVSQQPNIKAQPNNNNINNYKSIYKEDGNIP